MFCSNCGTKLDENQKFCPECGKSLIKENAEKRIELANFQDNQQKQSKCWNVFAGLGLGLGIGGASTFWIPFMGVMMSFTALVFSILGFKSQTSKGKAVVGFVFSIVGCVIGLMITSSVVEAFNDLNSFYY